MRTSGTFDTLSWPSARFAATNGMLLAIMTLAACQTSGGGGQIVTAEQFDASGNTEGPTANRPLPDAPSSRVPRRAFDVEALLAASTSRDDGALAELRTVAGQSRPGLGNNAYRAAFFFRRARANYAIGQEQMAARDYVTAERFMCSTTAINHRMRSRRLGYDCRNVGYGHISQKVELSLIDVLNGRFDQGLARLNMTVELIRTGRIKTTGQVGKAKRAIALSFLTIFLARGGELEAADKAMVDVELLYDWKPTLDLRSEGGFDVNLGDRQFWAAIKAAAQASVYDLEGDLQSAEIYHQVALANYRFADWPDTLQSMDRRVHHVVFSLLAEGFVNNLRAQGKPNEAEAVARQMLLMALETSGRYSTHTVKAVQALASIMADRGRFSEVARLARSSLKIQERLSTDRQSTNIAYARKLLADALFGQRQWQQASDQYQKIFDAFGPKSRLSGEAVAGLAFLRGDLNHALALLRLRRATEAIRIADAAEAETERRFGSRGYATYEAQAVRAIANAMLGRTRAGIAKLNEVMPRLMGELPNRGDVGGERAKLLDERLRIIVESYLRLLGLGDGLLGRLLDQHDGLLQ